MQDVGLFIGFFVILVIFAVATADGTTIFGDEPIEKARSGVVNIPAITNEGSSGGSGGTSISSTGNTGSAAETPRLTDQEIETEVARLYRQLDSLREDLREAELREPVSPYVGRIDMRIGNARRTDPESEYITLRSNHDDLNGINISDWYIESYVTEKRAAIPQGTRVLAHWRDREEDDIMMLPDDFAYLVTGERPFNVSFHENLCTGYLGELEDITPSLARNCPRPLNEMIRHADIKLDDDSCYEFVEDIRTCSEVDEDVTRRANISGSCKNFIEDTLNYNSCVDLHITDPFFDDYGSWRIYFDRDEELWRYEREILRLRDENDLIVDVIEY